MITSAVLQWGRSGAQVLMHLIESWKGWGGRVMRRMRSKGGGEGTVTRCSKKQAHANKPASDGSADAREAHERSARHIARRDNLQWGGEREFFSTAAIEQP